jgi:hypothetical protein
MVIGVAGKILRENEKSPGHKKAPILRSHGIDIQIYQISSTALHVLW